MASDQRHPAPGWLLCRAILSSLLVPAMLGTAQGQEAEQGVTIERQFQVRLSRGWTDNLTRAGGNDASGTYNSAGVLANVQRQSRRLQGGLRADLDYREYSDQYDDETLGTLTAFGDVHFVPNRFVWASGVDLGQGRTDAFAADGPGNRERITVMRTGPRVSLPLGRRTNLELGGVYSERRYEESDALESEDKTYDVGVYREVSRTARVGLVATATDVEYQGNLGYGIDSVALRYERTLATGSSFVEVGRNELDFQNGTTSGSVARVAWNRRVGVRSRIGISANHEFGDSGDLIDLSIGALGTSRITDVLLTPDPLELNRVAVQFEYGGNRSRVAIQGAAFEENYQSDDGFDNEGVDVQLTIDRQFTQRLTGGIVFGHLEREFSVAGPRNVDQITWLFLDRQIGRHILIGMSAAHNQRRGQDAFEEALYELRFVYAAAGTRRSGIPPSGSSVGQVAPPGQAAR